MTAEWTKQIKIELLSLDKFRQITDVLNYSKLRPLIWELIKRALEMTAMVFAEPQIAAMNPPALLYIRSRSNV